MPNYRIEVVAESTYLPEQSLPHDSVYGFTYDIRIRNVGDIPAQLISRRWLINDASGRTQQVQGLGVVGRQPLLQPGESFQYSSGCSLTSATGTMQGSYFFVAEDGHRFDVDIPVFVLDASDEQGSKVLH